ncbi:hypothetical protein AC249_AIPGENE6318 [Exaiptasia diaphana]|nr:hypothetical protein AC249_AIPGENE6318 [Exaiptasia diaphana]
MEKGEVEATEGCRVKTATARRPDLILEMKEKKKIWICDMACPQQHNIEAKRMEKLTKYRQLAFELRERRPGYDVKVVPVIIGALGGGIKMTISEVSKLFENHENVERIVGEMQKTVLMNRTELMIMALVDNITCNGTSSSVTESTHKLEWKIKLGFNIFISILVFTGNALVLLLLTGKKAKTRTTPFEHFVGNLSVSDIAFEIGYLTVVYVKDRSSLFCKAILPIQSVCLTLM